MEVCITDPHFTTVTVVKEGYNPNTQNITQYPGKDQTIDIYANLTPVAVQPVANFNGVPTTGFAPLPVQFTDTSTGPPATGAGPSATVIPQRHRTRPTRM